MNRDDLSRAAHLHLADASLRIIYNAAAYHPETARSMPVLNFISEPAASKNAYIR